MLNNSNQNQNLRGLDLREELELEWLNQIRGVPQSDEFRCGR